ncbi:MAG: efflux RND transporter periplasmic adaptor subunit, partial [Gemmatimonadales bacterium]
MSAASPRRRISRTWWIIGAAALVMAVAAWILFGRNTAVVAGAPMSGMKMAPAGEIQLSAGQLSQFGVTFDTVKLRVLSNEIRAAGVVTFDETRIAQITPKFAGYVERLYVNAVGQPVSRGQPVAAIFSPELVSAQTDLLLAGRLDRTLEQSPVPGAQTGGLSLLSAARQRLGLLGIPNSQIDDILRSGKVQRTLTVYSPFVGIVVEKNVVQGQSVSSGMQLITVADLSSVWVNAELREADAGGVGQGSQATVE